MKDMSGQSIKSYRLEEKIGEGGFGVVYRAWQGHVERTVAIKSILPAYANHPEFIRRFDAEAHLIARLEHPYIVPLYDYWRDPTGAYLVMRWLRGGSLLHLLRENGPCHPVMAAQLLDQIAGALTVAHRNKVIHQDIKPANILLDSDGNAYLTDFGIAQDVDGGVNLALVDGRDDMVHGSPAYMAPEQITRASITSLSDIYSLGLVLFEMLAGENPFDSSDMIQTLHHQTSTTLPALQDFRPELEDTLNIVVWRATAKEPDVRYSSVMEMAQDFRNTVSHLRANGRADASVSDLATSTVTTKHTSMVMLSNTLSNPYKGLRPFQEADSAHFYGRERVVSTLLECLTLATTDYSRFLAVVGPSGSGKSSVVKAGLFPALRNGEIPGSDQWYIVEMTPGADPIGALETTLLSIAPAQHADRIKQLRHKADLASTLDVMLPNPDEEVFLLIDQFEEIFTLLDDEQERKCFLDLLTQVVVSRESRIRLLITLRADFYDRPLLYEGFGDLLRKRTEVVLPMSRSELSDAIVKPADYIGMIFETGLVDRIVEDVIQQPGALPLLQYTLTELFERRQDQRITFRAYQQLDGVSGALVRRAESVYEGFNEEQRAITKQIFLRLVSIGDGVEDTRRRVLRGELLSIHANNDLVSDVLNAYAKYRLLSFDYEADSRAPTVEVAHEALIRKWDRLQLWLSNSRESLRVHRELSRAAYEWQAAKRNNNFVAMGARLIRFEELSCSDYITLSENEIAYVKTSVAIRQRGVNRRRAVIMVLVLFLVVSISLAGIAFNQRDRADSEAKVARSRELAASALVNRNSVDLSLLLSLESLQVENTFEGRNSLLLGLQTYPRLLRLLHGHSDALRTLALAPEDRIMASAGREGEIILWDTSTYAPIGEVFSDHTDWINTLSFSPDMQWLASGGEDGLVMIWDIQTHTALVEPISNVGDSVLSLLFDVSGDWLFIGNEAGQIYIYDLENLTLLDEVIQAHDGAVLSLVGANNNTLIASVGADDVIHVWDSSILGGMSFDSIEPVETLIAHQNWVMDAVFSPDGKLLASGDADGRILFWNTNTGELSHMAQRAHGASVRGLDFSNNGDYLVSVSDDGLLLIWKTSTGELVDGIVGVREEGLWDVAYAIDNIVTVGTSGDIAVWSAQSQPTLGLYVDEVDEQLLTTEFSPDASRLVVAGGLENMFTIQMYDSVTHAVIQTFRGHEGSVTSLDFSADGELLVSSSLDRTVRIWSAENGESLATLQLPDSVFDSVIWMDAAGENYIAAADNTGTITIWQQQATGWQITDQLLHDDRVEAIAVDTNGERLVAGLRSGLIYIWSLESRRQIVDPLRQHNAGILGLAFSPDGHYLVTASRDTSILVWDMSSLPNTIDRLRVHDNWVMDVAFHPDGHLMASAGGDGNVILWDTSTWQQIGDPFDGHTDWVSDLVFRPYGDVLVSVGRDGRVVQWSVAIEDWQEIACQIANRRFSVDELTRYLGSATLNESACSELLGG